MITGSKSREKQKKVNLNVSNSSHMLNGVSNVEKERGEMSKYFIELNKKDSKIK